MLQQFSNQFPLPNYERPTKKDEAIEMGQIALDLLEESLTEEGTLNLPQRAILAKLYLATIEGKATLAEQIQKDLDLEGRKKANYLTNTLKTFLDSEKTTPKLITATARCPEDRNRQGYYLKVVRTTSANETAPGQSQQITEIKCKIQKKLEDILKQIKSADEEKDILPIEESARQTVLATIENIQQAVEETLSVTSRGFGETNRELLKILLEASEKCEAITRPGIAKKIKKPEEAAKDETEVSSILYKLNETLKRSPQTKLALKSQKDHRNRKRFGWYLGLKEEAQEPQVGPKLPASKRKLSDNQKQTLKKLIARAAGQALHRARREVTILEALKLASRRSLQITPAYCQYVALQLFQTKYPKRNFEDKLIAVAEIPEADLGFRIVRTDQDTWEAVLSKNEKTLQPILAEIAAEKKTATEKNPEELKKRVHEGLKHLRAHDTAAIQSVFDVLIKNYTEKEGLSLEEIAMRSRHNKKDLIFRWLKRVQALNKKIPTLLGFNVIQDNAQKYSLTLIDTYAPAEIAFSGHSAPSPIKVEGGTNFDRAEFDKFIADLKGRGRLAQAKHTKQTFEILANYSEKGQAISRPFLESQAERGKSTNYIQKLQELLKRLFRRKKAKIVLSAYEFGTYYLSTTGTRQPAKKTQTQRPSHTENRYATEPDSDFAESDQESPPILDSPAQAEDFGSIADIGDRPVTLKEETIYRPKIDTDDDDREAVPTGPVTPLMELQHAIIDTARYFLRRNNPKIIDLKYLEEAVTKLNTNRQPHLIKVQSDYLSKVRKSMKKADPETGIIPAHIVIALYSV